MSFIVPVIYHGRQGLCYLNLSGMVIQTTYPQGETWLCVNIVFQVEVDKGACKLTAVASLQS